jgi:ubiquinone/menaquinone biosynthesis C-methylase UbiE
MGLRARLFALTYDQVMGKIERAGLADIRDHLLRQATGDVLEIGAGTGGNLTYYRPEVGALTLTEPDPSMLQRLARRTEASHRPVTVLRAPAEDLPFDDDTFDTVVSALVLCGVDDQPRAVREVRRVLRPGGRLLFIEHVRADEAPLARRQDRLNWVSRMVAGCDCNRPTLRTLQDSGLVIEDLTRGELPRSPSFVRPLVTGIATSPALTATRSSLDRLPIGDHP